MDEYVAILLQNGANRLLDAQKLGFSRLESCDAKYEKSDLQQQRLR
jgi:hypothetical protein